MSDEQDVMDGWFYRKRWDAAKKKAQEELRRWFREREDKSIAAVAEMAKDLHYLRECVQAADEKDAAEKDYRRLTGSGVADKNAAIRYGNALAAYDAARAKVKL